MAIIKKGEITARDRARFARLLTEKKADLPCPRCNHSVFTVVDRETFIPVGGTYGLAGGIQCVSVICDHCGFVANHVVPTLENNR